MHMEGAIILQLKHPDILTQAVMESVEQTKQRLRGDNVIGGEGDTESNRDEGLHSKNQSQKTTVQQSPAFWKLLAGVGPYCPKEGQSGYQID